MTNHLVYGLDIETGCASNIAARALHPSAGDRVRPLDPGLTPITRVALSTAGGDRVFEGDEVDVLGGVDRVLADLEPGILATWNGSGFALPYLADRAGATGVRLGLHLAADPRLRPRGEMLVGHRGAYRAAWYDHQHLDAARLFRSGRRPLIDVEVLLRGIGWVGSARTRPGGVGAMPDAELTHDATHAHAVNDARLVRSLVEARLPAVARQVDRVSVRPAMHRDAVVATGRATPVARRVPMHRIPLSPAHPAVRAALAARPH